MTFVNRRIEIDSSPNLDRAAALTLTSSFPLPSHHPEAWVAVPSQRNRGLAAWYDSPGRQMANSSPSRTINPCPGRSRSRGTPTIAWQCTPTRRSNDIRVVPVLGTWTFWWREDVIPRAYPEAWHRPPVGSAPKISVVEPRGACDSVVDNASGAASEIA